MNTFWDLPDEIIHYTLTVLPARDIVTCAATCKRLNNLLKGSSHLKLIVELAVHGLRLRYLDVNESDANGGTALQRLEALGRSQASWRSLKPPKTEFIPMDRVEYEIGAGLFGHAIPHAPGGFRGLQFHALSVDTNAEECRIWRTYNDVGINVLDFSFDTNLDLLVLVEFPHDDEDFFKRVFLRTLSGNASHPAANNAVLVAPGEEAWDECEIKIAGYYLAIMFYDNNTLNANIGRLCLWNWQTGELLYTCSSIGGYAFLSIDAILLFVAKQQEDPEEQVYAEIELLTIGSAKPRIRLSLPYKSPPRRVVVLSDRPIIEASVIPNDLNLGPYVLDESAERVILIQLFGHNHQLFIACRPLIRLLKEAEANITPPTDDPSAAVTDQRLYEWSEWGPNSTFLMAAWNVWTSLRPMSGSKFCAMSDSKRLFDTMTFNPENENEATLEELGGGVIRSTYRGYSDTSDEYHLIVLDFNPRPIIRAADLLRESMDKDDGDEEGGGAADEWSDTTPPRLRWETNSEHFTEPIICRLPFRVFQKKVTSQYEKVMLGVDHIIGMTAEESPSGCCYDVLTFRY
ncbi:hypothetical protein FRC18_008245 [Serendipita sp. 400]|nr:hypothetical protein FRC18_008245 [Serendipita sp. 400]